MRPPLRLLAACATTLLVGGSLVAQAPVKPVVPAGWTTAGTLDAGFVSATGNTDLTTLSLGDKLTLKNAAWTLSHSLAYVYGKTSGKESANQLRIGARADYAVGPRVGLFAGVQFERNAYAGFNSRIEELAGVQWKAIDDSSDALTIDGGGGLTQQDNTDGTSARSPSARAAAAYKHTFKANTYFAQNVEYVADLNESGAYRMNSETALVAPIAKSISLKVSYLYQYNSRPPVKFGTTDRVFTSGLQISF